MVWEKCDVEMLLLKGLSRCVCLHLLRYICFY
jgi:hypothetical protein